MSEHASSSTSAAPSKAATPAVDDVDIDKLLNREATAFQREMEVERILKAFKLKCVSPCCIIAYDTKVHQPVRDP